MELPSMVQRSGDTLIVRSVVSGNQLYLDQTGGAKLVRHMRMVHGCTDGIAGNHAQSRGKRGINREARKRKLEQNISSGNSTNSLPLNSTLNVAEISSLEQVKNDLERQQQKLQRDIEAFNKQQEEQKEQQKQQINAAEAILAAAYEQQLRAQREYDLESLKALGSAYENRESPALDAVDIAQTSPPQTKHFNLIPAHTQTLQQHSQSQHQPQVLPPQRPSFELTPSPSGSASSPPPPPQQNSSSGSNTPNNLSTYGPSDEPSNNRLLKCSLCDYTTLYRSHLEDHEIEEHCNAKFYRCEKCSYVTHIKARFSKHVKYHSMPMIKCVTCDFRTPYKWNLDRHMKNHGGTGPFKCAACDFTADIKQSLTVHEMNHHVPPVGHAAGMTLARRRNKVGGTDLNEDFFSDSAELLEDHYNNNHMDDYDELLLSAGHNIGAFAKRSRYEDDEPTDLSQKGGSSDTSSVHNQSVSGTGKAKAPLPNLAPLTKEDDNNILNLCKDLASSRSSLTEIASMFFNEKQISEMLQPLDKTGATVASAQLSPTTTIHSSTSSRSLLQRRAGGFFDKLKSSSTANENLICPCGHVAKCLSESIIHRQSCSYSTLSGNDDIDLDEDDHEDDGEGRLEIDFVDDEDGDRQSHSALNLSVTGSTRCQHCRHRCKSSTDLLNHLKNCAEAAIRIVNDSYDSMSGESNTGSRGLMTDNVGDLQHPMENRVFIWNKLPRNAGGSESQQNGLEGGQSSTKENNSGGGGLGGSNASLLSANNDENSYYGVETAPGYGEVTKKMTPEEEAANSSLKKVYKCPHCSFWASTASRFHVHIVGHLNKKPFECSLCSYRSNWRWDITKHIRLKTIRDPSHKNARVLMNDETGRRNYTKYNKYITLMKVTEEDGDPKLMKSGEMTPNQVASLSFINDYNKQQQQSQNSSPSTTSVTNLLNGIREDVTLEPLAPKSNAGTGEEAESFIRLPLLASMMNAAMAQQQHNQHQKEQENATLITPSVTISAVKKSPPPAHSFKPNEDVILEVRQDGNEKKTFYKCRKCNFRHLNRDTVVTHLKIHYADANVPTVTATSKTANLPGVLNNPPQMALNPNLYMNKVLAMCLGQQTPQNSQHSNAQHSNLLAAGSLSGLALALAGKNASKINQNNITTNILEHGEQKASPNEASAQTSNTSSPKHLTYATPVTSSTPAANATKLVSSSSNGGSGGGGGGGGGGSTSSLEHLLTSPRGSFSKTPSSNTSNGFKNTTLSSNTPTVTTPPATSFNTINILNLRRSPFTTATVTKINNKKSCNSIGDCIIGDGNGSHFGGGVVVNNSKIINNENISSSSLNPSSSSSSSSSSSPAATLNSNNAVGNGVVVSGGGDGINLHDIVLRHCRLKHAGDIRIETLDRLAGNGIASSLNLAEDLIIQQQLQQNDQIEITRVPSHASNGSTSNNAAASNLAQLLEATPQSSQQHQQQQQQQQQQHQPSNNNNNKSKQQKCPLCTYICDSKSQMNYHISLHKPTQYECPMCTFVCAKKQHLSSHMRSVHQMTQNQPSLGQNNVNQVLQPPLMAPLTNTNNSNNNNNNANPLNMDFGMTLQLAASQTQQDSFTLGTPLAIDLSNLRQNPINSTSPTPTRVSSTPTQQHNLPPEYQYRMIYFCPKCPARYAQKHNDPQTAKNNLEEHLRFHAAHPNVNHKYECDYCDFRAPHETLIQTHRYLHTTSYQEKCNELYKNCKEDAVYKAPILIPITTTKKPYIQETIWIVENEPSSQSMEQHDNKHNKKQQQNSIITSSSSSLLTGAFNSSNSLLKKQLESHQSPSPLTQQPQQQSLFNKTQPQQDNEDSSSNTQSTSASIATSDLAADAESNMNSPETENQQEKDSGCDLSSKERCPYCPFESENMQEFKAHIQKHISVTQRKLNHNCEHCDYTADERIEIEEHTKVHFNSMEKLKQVVFFTSYDKLELSTTDKTDSEGFCEDQRSETNLKEIENLQIKKELQNNNNNNNNEDHVDNENVKNASETSLGKNNDGQQQQQQQQLKCNKIILYKSDGGLSIKKEPMTMTSPPSLNNQPQQVTNDNISERLRRRTSRSTTNCTNDDQSSQQQQQQQHQQHQQHQQQQQSNSSHKTILVNAKTGQVISRN
uniref:C2H2-type domain-containing protein n=1 Tax=Glossina palpalis gambiensis TaxID=67801 RepID=A0A1B0AUP8_9MUSC